MSLLPVEACPLDKNVDPQSIDQLHTEAQPSMAIKSGKSGKLLKNMKNTKNTSENSKTSASNPKMLQKRNEQSVCGGQGYNLNTSALQMDMGLKMDIWFSPKRKWVNYKVWAQ